MIAKLQHLFALSHQGARDLVKAVVWCFLCNLSLMLPVGAVLLVIEYMMDALSAGADPAQRVLPVSYTHLQPSFVPYPYTINPPPSAILPGQHALPMFQPPPTQPRRIFVSLSAEPDQVPQARAIIFRCGGIILS